ncbi:zinc finger and BTB domain-containing protein 10 [Tachyglossus aculeatus]|uniref:zinc finger and BTB domain-containing protein 10 n=1 Tax=Tachyglossus aculeatus TaxID=9261 RepID=UPI0018F79B73|nr:zinc finger and BTB domain-containing protein 10 [Tachyglossus aculeatus]
MSCAWCRRGPEGGGARGPSSPPTPHDELARGTRNYKRTLLLRHHLSADHRLREPNAQDSEDLPSELTNEEAFCDYNSRPNENSYCYQLLQELNEQRKKGILCDVNIVVSGRVFRAHKNILVAGSRFFKTLYCFTNKESRNQTTVTYLDVVAVQGFSVILDFLYSGNLVLTSQNAIEVMSVASYLQMTEVVQSCRNFIKDALNISIKSEAPEAVVVDYNRRSVSREGLPSARDPKVASFWATRNLTSLASSIKSESDGCYGLDEGQAESYHLNDCGWAQDSSPEVAENEAAGQQQGKVFVWNDVSSQGAPEAAKARRKNQTTKRFIYNIPPNHEEGMEDCSVMQPSVSYPEEDLQFIKEEPDLDGALLSGPDGERGLSANLLAEANSSQDGGDAGTSNDFKYGLLPGTSNDFKYGLLPESWPKQEAWENGESSSLIMNKLKCPHCNYVAKYRRTLKRHLLIHTGVRSFSCDICGKLFTRREHVKRHSLVHKKDKKYKCMVCKKIFMLAASVGIRHGSRRYGVCVDCADKSQPGGQEGVDQGQDPDFPREEEYEENEVGEADEELGDDADEQADPSRWDEPGDVCMALED